MRADRGGIVLGWIFKLILSLALFAVVAFETGAVVVAKVTADRVAISAAERAGSVYYSTHDTKEAVASAREVAAGDGATVVNFHLVNQGREVSVTVRKLASTFFIQHIPGLRHYVTADSTHIGEVR